MKELSPDDTPNLVSEGHTRLSSCWMLSCVVFISACVWQPYAATWAGLQKWQEHYFTKTVAPLLLNQNDKPKDTTTSLKLHFIQCFSTQLELNITKNNLHTPWSGLCSQMEQLHLGSASFSRPGWLKGSTLRCKDGEVTHWPSEEPLLSPKL